MHVNAARLTSRKGGRPVDADDDDAAVPFNAPKVDRETDQQDCALVPTGMFSVPCDEVGATEQLRQQQIHVRQGP